MTIPYLIMTLNDLEETEIGLDDVGAHTGLTVHGETRIYSLLNRAEITRIRDWCNEWLDK